MYIGAMRALLSQPAAAAIPADFSLTFIAAPAVQTADATSYTFTDAAIGAADVTRKVIVVVAARQTAGTGVPNVTGVTAAAGAIVGTEIVAAEGAGCGTWIYSLDIPTGTTATIVPAFDATVLRCGISVYRVVGATASMTDTQTTTTAAGDTLNRTPVIAAGGVAICSFIQVTTNAGCTWTNATEDLDVQMEGGSTLFTTANRVVAGSTQVTAAGPTGSNSCAMITASWTP